MSDQQKLNSILNILEGNGLNALVVGGPFNVRYVSGAWVPMAHAQRNRPMLAVVHRSGRRDLIVPSMWEAAARECAEVDGFCVVPAERDPLGGAAFVLAQSLDRPGLVGIDGAAMTVAVARAVEAALVDAGHMVVDCSDALRASRMTKSSAEQEMLRELALKTDHAINGYFHHLIANRASSALVMSEQLRIHSLERDIELSGYNACSRAKVGAGTRKFWPYAPNYDFASMEIRKYPNDTIVAEVSNTDRGYWSNAIRMAVNAKAMPDEMEHAYDGINKLRNFLLQQLTPGRICSEIYESAISFAAREAISVHRDIPLGFSIGVAPMEAPFICAGDHTEIADGMVMLIDLVVQHEEVLYRSRDTVMISGEGTHIVDWYKDWREPYLAIGFLADFAM